MIHHHRYLGIAHQKVSNEGWAAERVQRQRIWCGVGPGRECTLSSKIGIVSLSKKGARTGLGFCDEACTAAGATFVEDAAAVYEQSDMVINIKEPFRRNTLP